ncbi:hypothetical protein [Sphingomonas sp. 10B4]|uniref:hypothetical protein n=1 Tax=Sphingomonas sp. 10B4 TaxID=3048575 RepID=UPI002AB5B1BD|nr:hypothetical protein [Sphingomonas sp. 10B4]MDY7522581.1 hypothetical protein [Sphingomonas sp. 10B4]MEB0283978.1 hypothetical protein [Sphingomonas sp. 10B4]
MFLIGDSHALAIKAAALDRGLMLHGGMIDGGRNVNIGFHDRIGDEVRFRKPEHQALFETYLAAAGVTSLRDFRGPVLCLFGMNIHYLSRAEIWSEFSIAHGGERHLSQAVTRLATLAMIEGAIQFYKDLIDMGCTVLCPLPPRRSPTADTNSIPSVFRALEGVVIDLISATGARVIDHRHWSLDPEGRLKAEYAFPDPADDVHGSLLFGHRLIDQTLAEASTFAA